MYDFLETMRYGKTTGTMIATSLRRTHGYTVVTYSARSSFNLLLSRTLQDFALHMLVLMQMYQEKPRLTRRI